jgi:hypothetical protein
MAGCASRVSEPVMALEEKELSSHRGTGERVREAVKHSCPLKEMSRGEWVSIRLPYKWPLRRGTTAN